MEQFSSKLATGTYYKLFNLGIIYFLLRVGNIASMGLSSQQVLSFMSSDSWTQVSDIYIISVTIDIQYDIFYVILII